MQGILLALLARDRTGQGQRVEVSLLDGLLAMQQWDEVSRLNLGARDAGVPDDRHPLQAVYRTADGFVALVGWFRPNPLANVCRALDLPDLSADPRFDPLETLARPENTAALREILAARMAERSTADWIATLEAHDVLCGDVLPPAPSTPTPGGRERDGGHRRAPQPGPRPRRRLPGQAERHPGHGAHAARRSGSTPGPS